MAVAERGAEGGQGEGGWSVRWEDDEEMKDVSFYGVPLSFFLFCCSTQGHCICICYVAQKHKGEPSQKKKKKK